MANDDCGGQVEQHSRFHFPNLVLTRLRNGERLREGLQEGLGGVHLESIDAKLQFTSDCDKLLPERLYTCKYWSQ